MPEVKNFDCVIIGGGMIGAASALALAQLGLTIAIVEKTPPEEFSSSQPLDLRVSAISIASENLLTQLDAWQQIKQWRVCPYQRLSVWEQEYAYTEFNAQDIQQSHLGHIVENRLIQLSLWQQIVKHNNITLFCPQTLTSFTQNENNVEVELDKITLNAKLLIAADGANSKVRSLANIGITGWDYQQSAMLIKVKTQLPQQNITWQQFLPTGPVAMLPMPTVVISKQNNAEQNSLNQDKSENIYQGNASLVWYHQKNEIKRLSSLSNSQLQQKILQTFPKRLGDIFVENKASFPLTRRHANQYQQGRVLLLGDAAHTINPLAGQGVNLGFKDVLALQTIIAEAIGNGLCWSDINVLAGYEQKRRTDNLLMMSAMDGFYTAFSHPSSLLKALRNSALFISNKIPLVKERVLKHACGID
ncbi:MAG: 2-octaprenyl-3-methyl-6-methoxy-1,4-benzoquinol hydroxylase [Gammaproteobacteria bacterium]|nr:MAG: 2-octaprenyl-3-methyl-6-methoxy-1,4-benzoquinol hydroxylase [Gammaproteobacteria bacterium]